MKTIQKLAALILVAAGTMSTQVNAQESAVEKIVSNLVSNAISTVSIEIDQQVQKVTLSASNIVSYDGSQTSSGKVSIVDLAQTNSENSTKEKSEKDKQKANTDD
jgi:hypothetical protein